MQIFISAFWISAIKGEGFVKLDHITASYFCFPLTYAPLLRHTCTGDISTTVCNELSSPLTLLYYCFYSQILVFWNVKCYLPGGNGILIVTAVWAFSACEQNNWIILEVILLFRRLTRMVQPVSGEQICLEGLKVSACLEMGWGILTDPNNVNRGWRDVRRVTCLGFACVIRACIPGVGWSVLVYIVSANTLLRKEVTAKLNCISLI